MPYAEHHDSRFSSHRILIAGSLLAFMAGYINLVMLYLFSVPVSHMTGATTRLSADLGQLNFVDLQLLLSIALGFLLGAVLSGVIIGRERLHENLGYGFALILQGSLLGIATLLAVLDIKYAVSLGAMACGLQNAMASSYRGLMIRTTHVTGTVTDIGVFIGQRLRGRRVHAWKLFLLLALWLAFFFGGLFGVLAYRAAAMYSLAAPAAISLALGGYYLHWLKHRPE